jgi:hypothetical protein
VLLMQQDCLSVRGREVVYHDLQTPSPPSAKSGRLYTEDRKAASRLQQRVLCWMCVGGGGGGDTGRGCVLCTGVRVDLGAVHANHPGLPASVREAVVCGQWGTYHGRLHGTPSQSKPND